MARESKKILGGARLFCGVSLLRDFLAKMACLKRITAVTASAAEIVTGKKNALTTAINPTPVAVQAVPERVDF